MDTPLRSEVTPKATIVPAQGPELLSVMLIIKPTKTNMESVYMCQDDHKALNKQADQQEHNDHQDPLQLVLDFDIEVTRLQWTNVDFWDDPEGWGEGPEWGETTKVRMVPVDERADDIGGW